MWSMTLRLSRQLALWKKLYFAAALAGAIFLAASLF
jgi:hypothetical protein